MANTSFFTTFAMMMNIQELEITPKNTYLNAIEYPNNIQELEITPKNTYLNAIEYPTSTINDKNINTST